MDAPNLQELNAQLDRKVQQLGVLIEFGRTGRADATIAAAESFETRGA